jgi:hypothetical protein
MLPEFYFILLFPSLRGWYTRKRGLASSKEK